MHGVAVATGIVPTPQEGERGVKMVYELRGYHNPSMDYRTFDPPEDLQDLVRFWWTLESPVVGSIPHRLMAETCPNIVVVRTGSFTEADGKLAPPVHLAGPLSRAIDNTAHGPFSRGPRRRTAGLG